MPQQLKAFYAVYAFFVLDVGGLVTIETVQAVASYGVCHSDVALAASPTAAGTLSVLLGTLPAVRRLRSERGGTPRGVSVAPRPDLLAAAPAARHKGHGHLPPALSASLVCEPEPGPTGIRALVLRVDPGARETSAGVGELPTVSMGLRNRQCMAPLLSAGAHDGNRGATSRPA